MFAAATLVLMVVGALASITLLRTNLYAAAEQEAGREARLVTDMGLAAALARMSRTVWNFGGGPGVV